MSAKLKWLMFIGVFVSFFLIGSVAMARGFLGPINPLDFGISSDTKVAATLTLPPSEEVTYTDLAPGPVKTAKDRPVALLNAESAAFANSVSAWYADLSQQPAADEIVFTILSSLRYTSETAELLVTTTQPSDAAADKSLLLGSKEITLSNGTTAWATEFPEGEFPNRVIFAHDDLLITVASNLPIADVESFASNVIVNVP